MEYSAAKLVKNKASALNYEFRHMLIARPTPRFVPDQQIEPLPGVFREMHSSYSKFGDTIHYCVDETKIRTCPHATSIRFIEHKLPYDRFKHRSELTYLRMAICQSAFYLSLTLLQIKEQGYAYFNSSAFSGEKFHYHLVPSFDYVNLLVVGDQESQVRLIGNQYDSANKVVEFYIRKAIASKDWRTATMFDNQWMNNETDILSRYISVITFP